MGRNFASLVTDPHACEALLERCTAAPVADFDEGNVTATFNMVHKYLSAVPAACTVRMGGTDGQRIFVFGMARSDSSEEMLMVGGLRCFAVD